MAHDTVVEFLRDPGRKKFAALVNRTRGPVYRVALRVLGDHTLAEDVTQDIFAGLWAGKWRRKRVRSGEAFLRNVARSLAHVRRRSEGRRLATERKGVAQREFAFGRISPEDARDVRDAVLALPEHLRPFVELRYFAGIFPVQIARTTGSSERTVYARLEEARKLLEVRLAAPALSLILPLLEGKGEGLWSAVEPSAELARRLAEIPRHSPGLVSRKRVPTSRKWFVASGAVAVVAVVALVGLLLPPSPDGGVVDVDGVRRVREVGTPVSNNTGVSSAPDGPVATPAGNVDPAARRVREKVAAVRRREASLIRRELRDAKTQATAPLATDDKPTGTALLVRVVDEYGQLHGTGQLEVVIEAEPAPEVASKRRKGRRPPRPRTGGDSPRLSDKELAAMPAAEREKLKNMSALEWLRGKAASGDDSTLSAMGLGEKELAAMPAEARKMFESMTALDWIVNDPLGILAPQGGAAPPAPPAPPGDGGVYSEAFFGQDGSTVVHAGFSREWERLAPGISTTYSLFADNPVVLEDLPASVLGRRVRVRVETPAAEEPVDLECELTRDETTELEALLEIGPALEFVVKDAVTAAPVEGALVKAWENWNFFNNEPTGFVRRTSASGRVHLAQSALRGEAVNVQAPGYTRVRKRYAREQAPVSVWVHPLPGGPGTLAVEVLGTGGRPCSGVVVGVSSFEVFGLETDDSGWCVFENLQAEPYQVLITPHQSPQWQEIARWRTDHWLRQHTVMVRPGERTELRLAPLDALSSIRLEVVDPSGAPVTGSEVRVQSSGYKMTKQTGEEGEILFQGLSPGTYTFGLEDWKFTGDPLELAEGDDVDHRLVVGRTRLRGRLVYPDGASPGRTGLTIAGEGRERKVHLGVDSSFVVDGLAAGTYTLRATAKGSEDYSSWESEEMTLDVASGQSEVTLDIPLAGRLPAEVVVKGPGGGPIPGAVVSFTAAQSGKKWEEDRWNGFQSNRAAHFTLERLPPGRGTLRVSAPGWEPLEAEVELKVGFEVEAIFDFASEGVQRQ